MPVEPFNFDNIQLPAIALNNAPLNVLAELYLTECEARNLQPMTIEFYRVRIEYLLDSLGNNRVEEISTTHLRMLLAHLKDSRGWNTQNVNHAVQVWKGFFNYLEHEEIILKNPARRLEKLRQESRFPKPFTLDELSCLFNAIPNSFSGIRDRTACIIMLDTGVRVAELIIPVDDLDISRRLIRVFGKGRKERFVPFSPTTRRLIVKYLALRSSVVDRCDPDEEALWITRAGTPISQDALQYNLRQYGKTAKIEHVHPHRFRHTFATQFLVNGGNPQMLQRILGHTTNLMTQRYIHITDTHAQDDHAQASPVENWGIGRKQKRGNSGG